MAESKTKPTDASVEGYIAAIDDETRREGCAALAKLMTKVTKQKPKMWGPSIVGFGHYHYKYESGREGDSCLTGFSSRKDGITVYLTASFAGQDKLLSKLGRHRMGKACLYIRKIGDIDVNILEQLVVGSVAEMRRRHAPKTDDDLGFSYRPTKGGDVTILRNGNAVTLLRGDSANGFLAEVREISFLEQQQLMARITGNYKRGNERLAASHPRNRG